MTINRAFTDVTFWDPKAHKHYKLKHRINPKEKKYLQNYLGPNLTEDDKKKIEKIREGQKKSLMSMGTLDGTKDEDMKFDPFGNIEDEDEEQQAENSQENGMDSELKEDSSFAD